MMIIPNFFGLYPYRYTYSEYCNCNSCQHPYDNKYRLHILRIRQPEQEKGANIDI